MSHYSHQAHIFLLTDLIKRKTNGKYDSYKAILTFARKYNYCWDFIVSEEHKLLLYQVWKKMTRFFWPSFVTKQPEFLPMIYLVASYEVNLSAFLLFKTTAFSWQMLKSLNHLHKKRKHFPLSFPNNLYLKKKVNQAYSFQL